MVEPSSYMAKHMARVDCWWLNLLAHLEGGQTLVVSKLLSKYFSPLYCPRSRRTVLALLKWVNGPGPNTHSACKMVGVESFVPGRESTLVSTSRDTGPCRIEVILHVEILIEHFEAQRSNSTPQNLVLKDSTSLHRNHS